MTDTSSEVSVRTPMRTITISEEDISSIYEALTEYASSMEGDDLMHSCITAAERHFDAAVQEARRRALADEVRDA